MEFSDTQEMGKFRNIGFSPCLYWNNDQHLPIEVTIDSSKSSPGMSNAPAMQKLWGGRFTGATDPL